MNVNFVVREESGGYLTALDIGKTWKLFGLNALLICLFTARKIGPRGTTTSKLLESSGAKTWQQLKDESAPFDPPENLLPPSTKKDL